jgi:hypothetical protein
MYTCQGVVLIEWGKPPMTQVVTVRTNAGLEGNMETIGEYRAHPGNINLVILKTEILSALSAVGSATTMEELQQADAAYKKALCTALEACAIVRTSEPRVANKFKWSGWP